ncbi:MAG TPA: hypothetical protein V6C91_19800 [Coleofasciculaceae cyanobacterium]
MSEDQQKQPELESSQPQMPPTSAAATPLGTESDTTQERREKQKLPFFKAQTVKVLQGTIGLLERIVDKLEAEPEPVRKISSSAVSRAKTTPSVPVPDTVTATLGPELESSVSDDILFDTPTVPPEPAISSTPVVPPEPAISSTPVVPPEPAVSNTPVVPPEPAVSDTPAVTPEIVTKEPSRQQISQPVATGIIDRLLPSFDRLQAFWDATLAKVRLFLPSAWSNKLSDWALTGAIAGVVVVVLVTTAALLPSKPAQVAQEPADTVANAPKPIPTPPELKAPKPPQPVEVAPPPEPELTPEQSLVAAVQKQVAEITDRYGNGLIRSVEANFLGSRLIVKVSNDWYTLNQTQQNQLADEILYRSRELDFSKLEITDLQGALLARSPVVGSNMVILRRQELVANL